MKSFENFEMPENRAERDLTLEDLNDNLNKKLNKILNLLEKQQSYSPLVHTHDFETSHDGKVIITRTRKNRPLFP